jgi:hypothetical protein
VGLNSLKSLNLTNVYPNNNNKNKNNKVKSKPLELFELAGKKGFAFFAFLWNSILASLELQNSGMLDKPDHCTVLIRFDL